MALVKITDLIKRAAKVVNDEGGLRWPNVEWLDWYHEALVALLKMRPDASTVTRWHRCEPDSKQALEPEELRLIDIKMNRDGLVIRSIDESILSNLDPNWRNSDEVDQVEYFVYDDRNPKQFYLYPVPVAGLEIELIASTLPAPVTISDFDADAQVIAVDDIYQISLLDYMLYRGFSKDAAEANQSRAILYLQSFNRGLGDKTQTDLAVSPNNS